MASGVKAKAEKFGMKIDIKPDTAKICALNKAARNVLWQPLFFVR